MEALFSRTLQCGLLVVGGEGGGAAHLAELTPEPDGTLRGFDSVYGRENRFVPMHEPAEPMRNVAPFLGGDDGWRGRREAEYEEGERDDLYVSLARIALPAN